MYKKSFVKLRGLITDVYRCLGSCLMLVCRSVFFRLRAMLIVFYRCLWMSRVYTGSAHYLYVKLLLFLDRPRPQGE